MEFFTKIIIGFLTISVKGSILEAVNHFLKKGTSRVHAIYENILTKENSVFLSVLLVKPLCKNGVILEVLNDY